MKKLLKSKYFKSKKGFSLMELLCAIVVLAIVVSATATGLAISYTSITNGSQKNKASSLCQEYCDILMTYVENITSSDPDAGVDMDDAMYNELFIDSDDYILKDQIHISFRKDIKNSWESYSGETFYNDVLKQITPDDVAGRDKEIYSVYYTIDNVGSYNYIDSSGATIEYVNYEVTVYIDYTDTNTAHCSGIVSKPKVAA